MKYILQMPSYTYGQKAAKLLRSAGHQCELKRRDGDCGYDLHIYGNSEALKLLDKNGILYSLKGKEGAS